VGGRKRSARESAFVFCITRSRCTFRDLGNAELATDLFVVTQGHLGVVGPDRLVYDAQTTSGGSGAPASNANGKVIGVNFAILAGFSGSNFAVPTSRAAKMVETSKSTQALR
jgi:hypothetical protein